MPKRIKIIIDVLSNMSYTVDAKKVGDVIRNIKHVNREMLVTDKLKRYAYTLALAKYLQMAGITDALVDMVLYNEDGEIVGIIVDPGR